MREYRAVLLLGLEHKHRSRFFVFVMKKQNKLINHGYLFLYRRVIFGPPVDDALR